MLTGKILEALAKRDREKVIAALVVLSPDERTVILDYSGGLRDIWESQ